MSFGVSQFDANIPNPQRMTFIHNQGQVRLTLLNLIELRLVSGMDRKEILPATEWFAESFCAIYCHVCFVF